MKLTQKGTNINDIMFYVYEKLTRKINDAYSKHISHYGFSPINTMILAFTSMMKDASLMLSINMSSEFLEIHC